MSTALILAEPEPFKRDFLERQLAHDGFSVLAADDPLALRAARADLALLGDTAALERWRPPCPVIVLGREDADAGECARAFAHGCDDYVQRPFVYEELVARIHAVLRRASARAPRRHVVRGLVVDVDARRVTLDGRVVTLPGKEFDLLAKLATEPMRVFRKDELLREVWGFAAPGRTRTLDSHASRLRRRLADAGGEAPYVINVWAVGYRLIDPD